MSETSTQAVETTTALRSANLTAVWVPGTEQEAMQDLTRAGMTSRPRSSMRASTSTPPCYAMATPGCLLRLLSQGSARDRFQPAIQNAIEQWTQAIAEVLTEAGLAPVTARERGEDAVIQIQGALIVARGLAATDAFDRTLQGLPNRLLAPAV